MWKVGNKSRVICRHCKGLKDTTTMRRPVKVGDQILNDILVGVCDTCDKIATIQQVLPV
jgi:RNase P subunit RPR2